MNIFKNLAKSSFNVLSKNIDKIVKPLENVNPIVKGGFIVYDGYKVVKSAKDFYDKNKKK